MGIRVDQKCQHSPMLTDRKTLKSKGNFGKKGEEGGLRGGLFGGEAKQDTAANKLFSPPSSLGAENCR